MALACQAARRLLGPTAAVAAARRAPAVLCRAAATKTRKAAEPAVQYCFERAPDEAHLFPELFQPGRQAVLLAIDPDLGGAVAVLSWLNPSWQEVAEAAAAAARPPGVPSGHAFLDSSSSSSGIPPMAASRRRTPAAGSSSSSARSASVTSGRGGGTASAAADHHHHQQQPPSSSPLTRGCLAVRMDIRVHDMPVEVWKYGTRDKKQPEAAGLIAILRQAAATAVGPARSAAEDAYASLGSGDGSSSSSGSRNSSSSSDGSGAAGSAASEGDGGRGSDDGSSAADGGKRKRRKRAVKAKPPPVAEDPPALDFAVDLAHYTSAWQLGQPAEQGQAQQAEQQLTGHEQQEQQQVQHHHQQQAEQQQEQHLHHQQEQEQQQEQQAVQQEQQEQQEQQQQQEMPLPPVVRAIVEYSTPQFASGKFAWYGLGFSVGLINGLLAAAGIPYHRLPSTTWKAGLGLRKQGKEGSIALARHLAPTAGQLLKRKKDHGRAEALLMAAWGLGIRMHPIGGDASSAADDASSAVEGDAGDAAAGNERGTDEEEADE